MVRDFFLTDSDERALDYFTLWINLQVMVRPRCGDFVYTSSELDVMIEDIRNFREFGIAGVVFGVLTCGGRVDTERTKQFANTVVINRSI
jgi:copper homeostasis protein CutC